MIATILLIGMTIAAGAIIWLFSLKPAPPPPTLYYTAQAGTTYPVWGDPTDCVPVLPHPTSYYTTGGTSNPNWRTYSSAWTTQCVKGSTGVYAMMNVSLISITKVSQPIPLAAVQFAFVCHNDTPTPVTTTMVSGSLAAMSWFPGSSQAISPNAPTIGLCATFNASGSGANSAYYNRLGFYDPVTEGATLLAPGDAFNLYILTPDSDYESPNPYEPVSKWNHPDEDDFHGAPKWCFDAPGACTIYLLDTQTSPQTVLAAIPVTYLG